MPTTDEYLAKLDKPQRQALEQLRQIVIKTVPDAEETFSYGLPAFKYNGRPLIYFGAFQHHLSLFPTAEPTELLKDKLHDYTVSKGTIQFTIEKPLPEEIIKELLQIRLNRLVQK